MEIYLKEKYLQIAYAPQQHWVEAIWYSYQSVAQLQEGMQQVLALIKQKQTSKLFMDFRAVKGTFTDANEWIAKEWIPQANQQGFRYGVLTCSDDVFTKFATDDLLRKIGTSQIKIFCNVEEGKQWLAEQ